MIAARAMSPLARLASASRRLPGDCRAVSATEFALIAPVFLTLLIGILDVGQMGYGNAVLNGAVQKAARDSALETSNTDSADAMVKQIVDPVFPNATYTSQRTSYYDFSDIGRPERWNDANNNGTCDNNEGYVDENGNGDWDEDIGLDGNGGANDVVVYSVTASYEPVFKVPFLPEKWNMRSVTGSAVKKNQPFADQREYGSAAGVCA